MTTPEALPSSLPDIATMSKRQKLAALLIILGPESAAQVLKSLDTPELEAVSAEMARMPPITQELRAQILEEMSAVAVLAGTSVRGGVEFAHSVLEKAVGANKASDILTRVSPSVPSPAAQRIADMEVRPLFNLVKDEHIQTIALVTSHLRPEKASEMLCFMRPELRDQVIERLALLDPTPVDVVEKLAEVLQRRMNGKTTRGVNHAGGVKAAATLLNTLNKTLSKTILASLEERNAELGQAIRQKMFIFADLARLDVAALQKVMCEVDMRDLALALKKADEALKTRLLSAVSRCAAETVNEEMSFTPSVKLKEIEAAQMRIIEVVRRLENDGEIDLESPPEMAGAA